MPRCLLMLFFQLFYVVRRYNRAQRAAFACACARQRFVARNEQNRGAPPA